MADFPEFDGVTGFLVRIADWQQLFRSWQDDIFFRLR
jgi:hypothetical protein